MAVKRSTTIRDRHRATSRRDQPPCHICQQPIDYALPYLHPYSFVVDHVISLARGGEDALPNKKAAHRWRLQQSQVRQARARAARGRAAENVAPMVTRGRSPDLARPHLRHRRDFHKQHKYPQGGRKKRYRESLRVPSRAESVAAHHESRCPISRSVVRYA